MNNTMVREIRGEKLIQNHPLKIRVRKIRGGGNYASKYGNYWQLTTVIKPRSTVWKCPTEHHFSSVLKLVF